MMRKRWLVFPILALAGCASHHAPPVVAEAPAAAPAQGPALPPGATPGMLVPQPLADGSFPTPNQGLTEPAAIWHLRAGLNVAALSCPGEEGAAIRAGYNAWLTRARAPLARAQTSYAAQYRQAGGYDEAMTRLYNFFAQTPVRPGLCAAAAAIVAETASATDLPSFARNRLAMLDQPFTDFYHAYAAWRDGAAPRAAVPTVIAAVAVAPPAPAAKRQPLVLDLSTLPLDDAAIASR